MGELFKDRVKRLREAKGRSIPEMVERTGLSDTTYRNFEDGSSKNPQMDKLIALADGLGVSLDELVGRKTPPHQTDTGAGDRYIPDPTRPSGLVQPGKVPDRSYRCLGYAFGPPGQEQLIVDFLVIPAEGRVNLPIGTPRADVNNNGD